MVFPTIATRSSSSPISPNECSSIVALLREPFRCRRIASDAADKVAAKMRELPVNDMFATNGKVREDGRMVHDMYLVQVKGPQESKHPWDYYKIVSVIPGGEAFLPLNESECPLVRK